LDSFRDEDFIYEKVQRENYGIKTKLDVHPPNSYRLFFPALKVRTSSEITWLLGLALREDAQFEKNCQVASLLRSQHHVNYMKDVPSLAIGPVGNVRGTERRLGDLANWELSIPLSMEVKAYLLVRWFVLTLV
jgi:hypothetical protein